MEDRQTKVLLIEDDPGDARMIAEMLSDSEVGGTLFDVENADRLSAGLTRIQKGGIDAILLDLGLPDSSGLDTFEKVRDQAPEVPIVMLTGLGDTELALEGMSKGAQDYLVKGNVGGDLLARTLRYAIERKAAEEHIVHLNSVLKAIRNVNQLIVTEAERGSLLRKSCDALVDARDYDAAWLGSFRDDKTFDMIMGSGFQEDIAIFSDHVIGGDHPPCIRDALSKKEQVMIIDRTDVCRDCFFKDACLGKEAAIIRVEHADKFFGLLAVTFAPDVAVDEEEKGLLIEVASDIGIALHNSEIADARKVAEDALLESEGKYRSLIDDVLDTSDIGIFILDNEFKVVWINHSTERYFGLKRKEVIGKAKRQLIRDSIKNIFEDPETFKQKIFATYDDNTYIENFDCHVLPGEERKEYWLEHWSQPIRSGLYKGGRIEHYSDITKQKRAEEMLRVAGEQFKTIVETAPSILMISDAEGGNIYVSPNCEEFTGYDTDELTGGIMQWVHEDDAKRAKDIFDRTFSRGVGCKDFECKAVKKNGDVWYASSSWEPIIDAKGVFKGVISQTIDITERKAAENALLKSERKYSEFFRTSRDPVFITTKEGRLVESNDALMEALGYETMDELLKIEVSKHYENPDDRKRFNRAVEQDGFAKEFPANLVKKDGSILNTLITATVLKDRDGNVTGFQGTIRDITDHKAADDALKESEGRYRALFETAKDAIFLSDGTGKFMDVNSAACGLLGYSKEELLKLSNREIDADPRGHEAFLKVRNGPVEEAVFEVNQRRKDGTLVPVEISGKRFQIGDRKLFLAIARDITDRKAAADALKESEIRYKHLYSMVRLMCDNLPDLIWTKDLESKFIFVNKACCDILLNARDADEPVGKDDIYFASREKESHPENPEYHTFGEGCTDSDLIVMETKKPQRFDESGNLKGEFVYLDVYKAPFWDENCDLIGTVGCARVVTKERRAEEQIKRSLQEKEVMLREIHHRVKNNLQVVSSLLNMQARNARDKDTIEILSEARDRIRTMSLIHSQLCGSSDLAEINMKGFVDLLLGQLLQSYPVGDTRIAHVVRVDDYPFPISTAVPVGLIVNELLSNAFKHAFDGRGEGKIEVRLTASEGGMTNLTVSDDGVGLPLEFDINESKTLGLRLVKILAEDQLQGTLEVTGDGGATFEIEFEMETG